MIENGMVVDSYWNDDEETEEQHEEREAEREYYDFRGRDWYEHDHIKKPPNIASQFSDTQSRWDAERSRQGNDVEHLWISQQAGIDVD